MSERDLRRLVHVIDPTTDEGDNEPNDVEFEVGMRAWHTAVRISDYLRLFRDGAMLSTNIYGEPYQAVVDARRDSVLSDELVAKVGELTVAGLQTIELAKPDLDKLFLKPAVAPDSDDDLFGEESPGYQNMLRELYAKKMFEQLVSGGLRDVVKIGVKGYLDQVPDSAQLFTYVSAEGTRNYISQDGFVATGLDLYVDPERPLSQRGGGVFGFLRSEYGSHQEAFDTLIKELDYLAAYTDEFVFDASDLLGYRPK